MNIIYSNLVELIVKICY